MPDSEKRVEKFNNIINNPSISGFVEMRATQMNQQLYNTLDDGSKGQWAELRISINPTRDNLLKASQALSEYFSELGFNWKIQMVDEGSTDQFPNSSWDTLIFDDEDYGNESDRQQLGKEICIYINSVFDINGDKAFPKSSKWWKDVMLKSWEKLQDADVKIGYTVPPLGDHPIRMESGELTPFSFTNGIDHNRRHNILLGPEYECSNEVKDIQFNKKDLEKHNISKKFFSKNRHEFYLKNNRYDKIVSCAGTRRDDISDNNQSFEDSIKELKEEIKKERYEFIFKCLPAIANRTRLNIKELSEEYKIFTKMSLEDKENKFNKMREEVKRIKEDFHTHINFDKFNGLLNISNENIDKLIDKNPAIMQLLFRKLFILQNEMKYLPELQIEYFSSIEIEDFKDFLREDFDRSVDPDLNKTLGTLHQTYKLLNSMNDIPDKRIQSACKAISENVAQTLSDHFMKFRKEYDINDVCNKLLSDITDTQFIYEGKEMNALAAAKKDSSVAQIILDIISCVLTLGIGLAKGIKSKKETGIFTTGFFKVQTKAEKLVQEIKSNIEALRNNQGSQM